MIGSVLLALAVLAVLAVIPAVIAQQHDAPEGPLSWWLYGFLIWPVAMIHAVWREPIDRAHERAQNARKPPALDPEGEGGRRSARG